MSRPLSLPGILRGRAAVLVLLLVVALVARGRQFGNPIVHIDEQFYLMVGRHMWAGAVPYVDIWDRKPIGLFLIYAAAAAPGGDGVLAYQLLASAFAVATALLVRRIAMRVASPAGALLAAILYLLYIPLLTGQGGQSPVFYTLFVAAGALGVVRAAERPGPPRFVDGAWPMLAIGVALQIKTSAIFEGMAFGLALMTLGALRRCRPAAVVAMAAGWIACALLPSLAALAVYWRIGHLAEFWYANFVSIFQRGALDRGDGLKNAVTLSLYLMPLLVAGAHGAKLRWRTDRAFAATFVTIWLAVAVVSVVIFGYYFDHYGLPIVAPAAASAATMLGDRRWRRWTMLLLGGALVFCLILPTLNQRRRGTPAQFSRLASIVRPHAAEGLLVWDNLPALYDAAGARLPGRYPFPTHLRDPNEIGAVGIDQAAETRRILDTRPALVVIERGKPNAPVTGTTIMVLRRLAQDYHRIAVVPVGRRDQLVYLRNGAR
jgi:hypothetical protein